MPPLAQPNRSTNGPFWDRLKIRKRTLAAGRMDGRNADLVSFRCGCANVRFKERFSKPFAIKDVAVLKARVN
jgi:hypothetical protein